MTSLISVTGPGRWRDSPSPRAPGYALQVSDRLLSRDGTAWDPEANKVVVFRASDAVVSIAYTGLAHIGQRTTDEWLAEQLFGEPIDTAVTLRPGDGPPLTPLGTALLRVRQALDRLPANTWQPTGLMLVICGVQWKFSPERRLPVGRRPVIYEIKRSKATGRFEFASVATRIEFASRHVFCHAEGSHQPDLRALAKSVVDDCRLEPVRDVVAETMRALAEVAPGYVGPDLMSVAVPSEPYKEPVTIRFHPLADHIRDVPKLKKQAARVAFSPWIVTNGLCMAPTIQVGGPRNWETENFTWQYENVPPPEHVEIAPGRFAVSSGVVVQRRKPWRG